MRNNFNGIGDGLTTLKIRLEELKEFDKQWKDTLSEMKNTSQRVSDSSILLFDFYERDKFSIIILDLHSIMGQVFTIDFLSSIFKNIPESENAWESWSKERLEPLDKLSTAPQDHRIVVRSQDEIEIKREVKQGKCILRKIFNDDNYDIEQLICCIECKRKKISKLRNVYAHKHGENTKFYSLKDKNLDLSKIESIFNWYEQIINNISIWNTGIDRKSEIPFGIEIKTHVRSIIDLILSGSSKKICESNTNDYDEWRRDILQNS